MHLLIVGAGAIGILFAHRLEQAGQRVSLLGRPAVVAAARAEGLIAEDAAGTHRLAAPVILDLAELRAPPDLLLLTVKAFDTASAARQIAPLTRAGVPVLLIQNGVDGEKAGLSELPDAAWYGAVTTLVADRLTPHHIRQSRPKAALGLAAISPGLPLGSLQMLFASAGFTAVRPYASYPAMKWAKLLLNILGNAVPAIVDQSPAEALADPRLCAVERAAYREALAVMRAAGVPLVSLPGYPVPWLARAVRVLPDPLLRPLMSRLVGGGRGGKRPSLHRDLAAGRRVSEVAFLNGAVVRWGKDVGLPTPVNQALTETLLAIAGGEESWESFRRQPARLAERCGIGG